MVGDLVQAQSTDYTGECLFHTFRNQLVHTPVLALIPQKFHFLNETLNLRKAQLKPMGRLGACKDYSSQKSAYTDKCQKEIQCRSPKF